MQIRKHAHTRTHTHTHAHAHTQTNTDTGTHRQYTHTYTHNTNTHNTNRAVCHCVSLGSKINDSQPHVRCPQRSRRQQPSSPQPGQTGNEQVRRGKERAKSRGSRRSEEKVQHVTTDRQCGLEGAQLLKRDIAKSLVDGSSKLQAPGAVHAARLAKPGPAAVLTCCCCCCRCCRCCCALRRRGGLVHILGALHADERAELWAAALLAIDLARTCWKMKGGRGWMNERRWVR